MFQDHTRMGNFFLTSTWLLVFLVANLGYAYDHLP